MASSYEECSFCNKKSLKELGEEDYLGYKETDNFVKCTYCENVYRLIGADLILKEKGYLHKKMDKITLFLNILYPLFYIPLIFLNCIITSNLFTICYLGLAIPGYCLIKRIIMENKLGINNTKQITSKYNYLSDITSVSLIFALLIVGILLVFYAVIGIGTVSSTREEIVYNKYELTTMRYKDSIKYYAVESSEMTYDNASQQNVSVDKIKVSYIDGASKTQNLTSYKADVDFQYSKNNEHSLYLKQKNVYKYIKYPSFSQKFLFMKSYEKLIDTITIENKIVIPENTLLKK